MATVLEEAAAVPEVGAGEGAAVVMEEKEPAALREVGAGVETAVEMEDKVEEAKEAGAGVEKEKVEEVKEEGEAKKPEGDREQGKLKAKKPKSRKPRSEGPHHPPYFEMIKEAIMAGEAGDGKAEASTYAIAKHVGEQHGEALPGNYRKVLAVQLRNFAAKGRLVRVKASFRLAPAEEKKALASAKKRRASRATAINKKASTKEGKKAAPARAKRAKKVAPPPAKPKQPRSIRSGVARKANKASA